MENKRINIIQNNILRLFDDVMTKEGKYSMPYSTADDDYADWSITYKIGKVSLWDVTRYKRC
jgi:aminoglycoside N3'-acetyltransferase